MTARQPSRARDVAMATVSNYMRQVLQIAVFLLLTPFILHTLGKQDFGLWMLIQATVGLMGLLDLGLSTSIVKFVADARGKGQEERIGHITATLFWIYLGLGSIMLLAALLAAPALPRLFNLTGDYATTAPYIFLLIAARAAAELPFGMFAVVFVGYQRQLLSNFLRIAGTLSYAVMAFWVLYTIPSLEALSWASLITGVGTNLVAFSLCLTMLPAVKVAPKFFRRHLVREVSSFSVYVFLIQVSLLIATRLDTLIVKFFLPLSAVAYYAVAMRVMDQAWVLCRQLTTALTPLLAELKGAGEHETIQVVLRKGTQLTVALAVPVLIGLLWLADDLLNAWLGPGFEPAVTPLRLLLASAMIGVIHGNAENILSMTGHQRFLALSMVVGQLSNLAITVVLINLMGLPGAALATLVASLIFYWAFICRRIKSEYGIGYFAYYRMALGPVIPGTVIMLLFLWAAGNLLPNPTLVMVAALEAIGCMVFFAGFYWLGLDEEERTYYLDRIVRISRFAANKKSAPGQLP